MFEEIICAGFGGQGILVVGEVLAIANTNKGNKATWFPSYGAAMRGGTANCAVVLSDTEIGSPLVEEPSILVCFNQPSMVSFGPQVTSGGVIIANDNAIEEYPDLQDVEIVKIKAVDIAKELGNDRCVNMVMLGALLKKKSLITLEEARGALIEIWGKEKAEKLLPINEKALMAGFDVV